MRINGIVYNNHVYDIVIDTSVFISVFRSGKGAYLHQQSMAGRDNIDIAFSVLLILEFLAVRKVSFLRLSWRALIETIFSMEIIRHILKKYPS